MVEAWTYTWNLEAQAAKRGRQEKVRNFIKYCLSHAPNEKSKDPILATNPIAAWESYKLDKKNEEVSEARIIRPKVLAKIMKAVDDVAILPLSSAFRRTLARNPIAFAARRSNGPCRTRLIVSSRIPLTSPTLLRGLCGEWPSSSFQRRFFCPPCRPSSAIFSG